MTKISFNNLGHLLPVNSKNSSFFFVFVFFGIDSKIQIKKCTSSVGDLLLVVMRQ